MLRRHVPTALVASAAGAVLVSKPAAAQTCTAPCYARTQAEITAGVTPTNTQYLPTPYIDVRRYGWSSSNTAGQNVTCLNTAISVAAVYGGTVQIPEGSYNLGGATDVINIPQFVWVRGAGMRATVLTSGNAGSSGALFRLGGAASGVLKYGCRLSDLQIELTSTAGKGIQLVETAGALVQSIYLEGPVSSSRSTTAVTIDGGNISAFFNTLINVIANHFHTGYNVTSTGTVESTTQNFYNCTVTGDVSTDTTSIGYLVAEHCGSGSVWYGGDLESCGTGAEFGGQSTSMVGARFEGNTHDLNLIAACGSQSFVSCLLTPSTILDGNTSGSAHALIGCTNPSNTFCQNYIPGQSVFFAAVSGQTPLIAMGYPGDTTAQTFQVQNSSLEVLFAITNQGKFARIANANPQTVTGSKGENAALASLITALANTGLIVDDTT
jgi:hypothetical protein